MAEKTVGKSIPKIDAIALATGAEKFADDMRPPEPLECAILYSPHSHAEIVSIDTTEAEKLEGVVDILHYGNVEPRLHTTAGQGFPEPSPYDTLLFDRRVRFTGDRVALAAAKDAETARRALDLIKVEYKTLEPVFDMEEALQKNAPRVHDGEEHAVIPVAYRPEQNIAAEIDVSIGDVEGGFDKSDFIVERTYETHYASHCALEPHAVISYFDEQGRLVIVSSTQVPFHARRIVSRVCGIPLRKIRVIKPRLGGGFGGKQEVFLEPLAALVSWRNRKPARIVLSREEVFYATRTRHAMKIMLKAGVGKDGGITALRMDGLLNAGAYGTHALTVLSNVGSKVLPMFNKIESIRFFGRSVYTNLPVGGAYRGYGATQGYFAFNQHIDIIARRIGMDVLDYIKQWHIREGETSPLFEALGEGKEGVSQVIGSCGLDECIDRGAEEIGWKTKRGKRTGSGDRVHGDIVRGVGAAVSMQGSGIPRIDMASASMKMNEDGSFNLSTGATDLGTGSDTILAQIAAEVLGVEADAVIVTSADTDLTPFDTGAYASSTTYVSGGAVKRCAEKVALRIRERAGSMLGLPADGFSCRDGRAVHGKKSISFEEIALDAMYARDQEQIQAQASFTADISPPPFMAQFAEIEVDLRTGRIRVVKFVSAVDCGRPLNPALAEGQVEGAALNGISYALCEDFVFSKDGKLLNPRFWDYKIYNTVDQPELATIIVPSNEETGPFGAKSVGEIAINGPAPAIANALYDAVGIRMYSLPMTPEKVFGRLVEEGMV